MPDMKRPRRIRADVLDHDRFAFFRHQRPIRFTLGDGLLQFLIQDFGAQKNVNESRPRNLGPLQLLQRKASNNFFGDPARRQPEYPRRLHGKICCEIAHLFFRRNLERNRRDLSHRKHPIRNGLLCRVPDRFAQTIFYIHRTSPL